MTAHTLRDSGLSLCGSFGGVEFLHVQRDGRTFGEEFEPLSKDLQPVAVEAYRPTGAHIPLTHN